VAAATADSLIRRILLDRCEVNWCMPEIQVMLVDNRICSEILFAEITNDNISTRLLPPYGPRWQENKQ
jgi:hypothetical protein